jgi:hypothetical protein
MAYVPAPNERDLEKIVRSVRNAHEIMGSAASTFGTDNRIVRTDGTQRGLQSSPATMDDSGNITGTPSIAVNHVQFPATQVPSADANALDDYEEGTFTPVLTFQTPGDLAVTYSVQIGTYTKIGRLVSCCLSVVSSAFTHTTAANACLISGLPFACAASHHFIGITKAGYTQFQVRARDTFPSQLEVLASGSGVANANVLPADMPSGGTINFRISIVYQV